MLTAMRALLRFTLLFTLALPFTGGAQEDTAHHRAVYAEIQKNEGSYRRAKATFKDDPIVFELQGWFDGSALRKITSVVPGEDGGGSEEYYLENGQPLFVYRQYRSAGSKPARVEDRFYFRKGRLFKWLGTDKKPVAATSPDFQSEAERLTGNAANFVAAFKGKAPAASARALSGTFLGIEEGDYAHWQMRTDGGEERSFFILRPDSSVEKVLAKPKSFQGRKCRVQWKESTENIPEAGGKITVEQILSVEWLGKN